MNKKGVESNWIKWAVIAIIFAIVISIIVTVAVYKYYFKEPERDRTTGVLNIEVKGDQSQGKLNINVTE
ncbi:hypothetical protein J4429_05330 [Candidatus Pacearchaeota archaeon]|nr:hypothetical protein [Candidatus Pacearchaeota archaeon]